jgi:ABC-type transport system involved in cytochrome c biogenesis ATPase subunit
MTAALELTGLSKTYKRPAVDELSLTVPTGGIYALLGPNGAGKTTTLRMVTGLVKPDYGAIKVLGIDALADPIGAKRLMAWLPDEPMLYDALTAMEYLEFVAGLWSVPELLAEERARELLETLDLWHNRNARCEGFSRGMKQKVALAGALVALYQGFADVSMGIGSLILGLGMVIVGEAVLRPRSVPWSLLAVVVGAILFRLLIAVALQLGLEPVDLKLATALLLLLALALGRLRLPGMAAAGTGSEPAS